MSHPFKHHRGELKREPAELMNTDGKICPSQKHCYVTPELARDRALATRATVGHDMSWYLCTCGYYHTTKRLRSSARLPPTRGRVATPDKVVRVMSMLLDADAIAIDALMQYPNADISRALEACNLSCEEGKRVKAQLEQEGIVHPVRDSPARNMMDALERVDMKRTALARLI